MQNYVIRAVTLHSGWKSIMRVGAIDCAQDENVPVICHYIFISLCFINYKRNDCFHISDLSGL